MFQSKGKKEESGADGARGRGFLTTALKSSSSATGMVDIEVNSMQPTPFETDV
jgi:hypothetical protein